jgi:ADP-ribosylarginine hydrolase
MHVTFPPVYGVLEREQFYSSIAYSGWGGASGHDAPLIAYDAILGCGGDWSELCLRGMLVTIAFT